MSGVSPMRSRTEAIKRNARFYCLSSVPAFAASAVFGSLPPCGHYLSRIICFLPPHVVVSDATSHKSRMNTNPTKFVGNREFT